MSSNILQVNYNEAGQIAQTLRAEAEEIARLHTQTRQRMEALQKDWRGEAGQSFQREMNDSVLPATLRASNALFSAEQMLVEIVNIIRQADEETAGYFKGLGGAAVAAVKAGIDAGNSETSTGDPQPRNMRELAHLVMNGDDPIRIHQIGPNEYLVIVQGTVLNDPNSSRNFGSAATTGLGLSSDFQEQVRLAVMSLPQGATVHMAGYSQGGIVAQNLAGDSSIQERVNLSSITTFGSPYSSPEVDGIKYQRFAAQGDIVPYLEGRDAIPALLLTPIIGFQNSINVTLGDRYPQTVIPGNFSDGLFGPHFEYSKSAYLDKVSMPFQVTAWDGNPTVYHPGNPNSGLSAAYQFLGNSVTTVVDATGSVVSAIGNAASDLGKAVADTVNDSARHVGNFFGNLF